MMSVYLTALAVACLFIVQNHTNCVAHWSKGRANIFTTIIKDLRFLPTLPCQVTHFSLWYFALLASPCVNWGSGNQHQIMLTIWVLLLL